MCVAEETQEQAPDICGRKKGRGLNMRRAELGHGLPRNGDRERGVLFVIKPGHRE